MNRNKCNRCGLINSASDENCRRCKTNLYSSENAPPRYAPAPTVQEDAAPARKIGSMVTTIAIALLIPSVFYYFKTRDDDKIRMNIIIEQDRQRKHEMSADRERESKEKKFIPSRSDGL